MRLYKLKFPLALLAGAAFLGLLASPAYAVVEVEIHDSAGTVIYTGTSCGTNCSSVVGNDPDTQFSINIEAGGSNGPGGPASVQVTGLITDKKAGTLTIEVSDTGFTSPVGTGSLIQTVNTNTPALNTSATGSVSGQGFYGTGAGNVFFCADSGTCTKNTPSVTFNSFLVTNPGQINSTPVNFVSPYSLDEVLNYNFLTTGNADVTATLSAVAPEPSSLLIFGTGLLVIGLTFRKKLGSKN